MEGRGRGGLHHRTMLFVQERLISEHSVHFPQQCEVTGCSHGRAGSLDHSVLDGLQPNTGNSAERKRDAI